MTLTFRPLRLTDALFCWRLASDPVVREASVDRRKPTVLGHLRWMREWTRRTDSRLGRVVERGGVPVGVFRGGHHRPSGGSEVSIALVAGARGRGIGVRTLRELTPDVALMIATPVIARVRITNHGSRRAFERADYFGTLGPDGYYTLTWAGNADPTPGDTHAVP